MTQQMKLYKQTSKPPKKERHSIRVSFFIYICIITKSILNIGEIMTNFTNLTDSLSSFYGVNPQETKLTFSKVFDFFNPYHKEAFKGLTEPLKIRLYKGLDYFDLEFLDGLAWDLRDKYELERQLEDNYIDRKIKEKILLDNGLLDEYQALKDEVFKDEDSRNDYFESVAEQLNQY
tara:strand:+ start:410 stop:937 length:528 start_codon:yes stop_codon:yes gene_type:complete